MPEFKDITYKKERKIGLPNYSSLLIGMSITIDWSANANEPIAHGLAWDQLDAELDRQEEIEKARYQIFSSDAATPIQKPTAQEAAPTPPASTPVPASPYQALQKGKSIPHTEHGKVFKPGS